MAATDAGPRLFHGVSSQSALSSGIAPPAPSMTFVAQGREVHRFAGRAELTHRPFGEQDDVPLRVDPHQPGAVHRQRMFFRNLCVVSAPAAAGIIAGSAISRTSPIAPRVALLILIIASSRACARACACASSSRTCPCAGRSPACSSWPRAFCAWLGAGRERPIAAERLAELVGRDGAEVVCRRWAEAGHDHRAEPVGADRCARRSARRSRRSSRTRSGSTAAAPGEPAAAERRTLWASITVAVDSPIVGTFGVVKTRSGLMTWLTKLKAMTR